MYNHGNYESSFPPLSTFSKDGADHAPKIPKRNVILPSGVKDPTGDLEVSINWQTENAVAQNKLLFNIDKSVKEIAGKLETVERKKKKISKQTNQNQGLIKLLEQQLRDLDRHILPPGISLFHFFDLQKREMASLKE